MPNAKEAVLHNFASPPHGAYPDWGVIRDSAGNLYGTTNGSYSDVGGGGTNNAGVVYKIDTSGNETVLYSFTGGADGSSPNSLIRDSSGNLYGTTTNGGASGAGVVFKINTSGHEKVLYSFTGASDGGNPYGGVVRDSAGNLYGVTGSGGNGVGVVFKVDSTGHETVLYSFTGGADGGYPNPVILDSAGNLYGTTTNGGGASDAGVVFKVDPTDHETVLYSFTGGDDGGSPAASVIRDPVGNLYGTTSGGGTAGLGVVFKIDTSGNETVLRTFIRGPHGNQPDVAGVIRDSVGNLYGTTAFGGAGGQGTVYKLDTNGNASVLYAFPGAADGQHPYNNGVISEWDGQLFGTTFYGGKTGAGVVYQLDGHDNETVLYSFSLFTANDFGQPVGGVIRDSKGNFYGTTFIGQADVGYGYGVVYKIDAAGHSTVLHNFTNGADGGNPYGGVIRDSKGNLYGTTSGGGASGAGVVFKIDTSGHETVLYTFTGGADGGYPLAGVILDSKGNLYGTTNGGGASGAGVVFKVDTSGNETVLYSFTGGDDGGYPLWVVLARDSAGNLYGTTAGGGASNAGVVFKVDTSGHETVLHSFTGGADGGNPYAGVILSPEGNLYGTADSGGAASAGVVFEIKP